MSTKYKDYLEPIREDQYEEVLNDIEGLIYHLCRPYTRNWCEHDLNDLYQKCRIRIWKGLPKYDPKKSAFRTFVSLIVHNTIKSFLHREFYRYGDRGIEFYSYQSIMAQDEQTNPEHHLGSTSNASKKAPGRNTTYDQAIYDEFKLSDELEKENEEEIWAGIEERVRFALCRTYDTDRDVEFTMDFVKNYDFSGEGHNNHTNEAHTFMRKKYGMTVKQLDNKLRRIKAFLRHPERGVKSV